jgi:hypothetical protein
MYDTVHSRGNIQGSFKFCMGGKLREKMEEVKGMIHFSVHFNMHTPMHIVFLNNFKNCCSSFKNETLHRRRPKIVKKTLESCDVQTFDYQRMQLLEYGNKRKKNNSWTIPTKIGSMVTHFQLQPYEFH